MCWSREPKSTKRDNKKDTWHNRMKTIAYIITQLHEYKFYRVVWIWYVIKLSCLGLWVKQRDVVEVRTRTLEYWLSMSHYASHYHYGSQSIAFSSQWECLTVWSQPVNCINLHEHKRHIALSEPTVYWAFGQNKVQNTRSVQAEGLQTWRVRNESISFRGFGNQFSFL